MRLIELATGGERCRLAGHRGSVVSLAFAPDGRTLASGSMDNTALVWDVTGRLGAKPCTPAELEGLWADLSGKDAARAYRALGRLALSPDVALPRLRACLRPAAAGYRQHLGRLVKDLDDDEFAVREKASEELAKLGADAEWALREALRGRPSAELRRRAERLLARRPALAPERLRELRALELLERLESPEARALLERLAQGDADAPLTRDAKAALRRPGP